MYVSYFTDDATGDRIGEYDTLYEVQFRDARPIHAVLHYNSINDALAIIESKVREGVEGEIAIRVRKAKCKNCNASLDKCDANGCGGRREKGWRKL